MAETGWTNNLREAVNEMNNQPDISANDSPRLKELCRVTAMEIKAVGGVDAATSLEMIGYIRELERSQVGGDDYVAWCRYKYNSEGGIQTIVTCDSDAKGAFKVYRASPSDFKQLTRLREIAKGALQFRIEMNGPCNHEEYMTKLCTQCEIREALAQRRTGGES